MTLISIADAAAICQVTPRTIRAWVRSGRLTDHGGLVDAAEFQYAKSRARTRHTLRLR